MSDDFSGFDMILAMLIGFVIGLVIGIVMFGLALNKYDKFCPECGRQYMTNEYCSYDGSELKEIAHED